MKPIVLFILLYFTNCALFAQIPSYVDTTGLLAWYPLDSSANNAYSTVWDNGVLYGDAAYGTDRFGVANHCYKGDGFSAIDMPVNNFPLGNAPRSVAAWFKSAWPYPGSEMEIFAWGDNSGFGARYGLYTDGSYVGFESAGAAVRHPFILDSQWHHLAVTYSSAGTGSTSIKVYYDGVAVTTDTYVSLTSLNTPSGFIHSIGVLFLSSYLYSWDGELDDIGVWDREISPCEVSYLYGNHVPAFTSGINQNITVCRNDTTLSLDSLLTIVDPDSGQTETWTVLTPPAHGTLVGAFTAISSGASPIVPSGLSYTPTTGYFGNDSCKLIIADCGGAADTATIHFSFINLDSTYLHTDTAVCSPASGVTLTAPPGYGNYLWSTGAVTDTIVIIASGAYVVSSTTACSLFTDTFHVSLSTLPSPDLGNDTSLCNGGLLTLTSAPYSGADYFWSTGATGTAIAVSTSGVYWLRVTEGGCSAVDSIHVAFYPVPAVNLGPDTSLCEGQIVTLHSSDNYTTATYSWNTGSTGSQLTVTTAGTYNLAVTENNCTGADTVVVNIKPLPIVDIGNNSTICFGSVLVLGSPEPLNVNYLWSNGSTDSSISVTSGGIYSLTVNDGGCKNTGQISVSEMTPPVLNLGPDTTLCQGQTLNLETNTDALFYEWSDGSNKQNLIVSQAGLYWATLSNQCGTASDTINITFDFCDIWFPTAFTPNNDGLNDIARVRGSLANLTDFSLSIFNRFGQLVFYTQDIYAGWNGDFKSTKQDVGTYYYMVLYALNGKKSIMKGDLQLVR